MAATIEIEYLLRRSAPIPLPADLDDLEREVCRYVDAAKKEGAKPESVILALRAAMRSAAPQISEHIAHQLIDVCIRQYFGTDGKRKGAF